MKKAILISMFVLTVSVCNAQEWFTSFEVAKSLALVQNKMLFVIWEGDLENVYPVVINDDKRKKTVFANLMENEIISRMIWDNFVPVKLPEYKYEEFSNQVKKTRGLKYFDKLIDYSIKIMDVNGNILNTTGIEKYYTIDSGNYLDFNDFIKRYSLNTSYLNTELKNYSEDKNFTTAFRLATKYLDFAIFVDKELKPEIIALANIYFDESKRYLTESDIDNKISLLQKNELYQIKEFLILNQPKKALRQIKRLDVEMIDSINKPLFAFLNYTAFKLLNKEENAVLWENEISLIDLKKSELIIENIGNDN